MSFAWIFFRAPSLSAAFTFIGSMASPLRGVGRLTSYLPWLGVSAALLLFEATQRDHEHPLELRGIPLALRWAVYASLMLVILFVGSFGARNFIYVQF